jgi:peroxisomal membrane protein 2
MPRPAARLWAAYERALDDHPFATRSATAALLAAASELTASTLARRRRSARRAALLALWGAVWSGPSGHTWQLALHRAFGRVEGRPGVAVRVAADAAVYGPATNLLTLAFISAVVDRRGMKQGTSAALAAFPSAQARAWRVWPAASVAAYAFVPPRLRTPFFNCVAYGWGVALILTGGRGRKKKV